MKRTVPGIVPALIYFLLILAPVLIMLVAPARPGREFWREFSVALGFIGISLLGLQFVPTARLPLMADVFPLDALYYFHHLISIVAFGFALAHPIILFVFNPFTLQLLNIFAAPTRARVGVLAVIGLLIIVISSVWRKELETRYELWRIIHRLLSLGIVVFVLWHMFGVNYHMSVPAQRVLWLLLILVWLAAVVYVRGIKPWQMTKRPYRVVEVRQERGASWTLALEPQGHEGLEFMPGQFSWLTLGRSPYGIKEHPFSMASSAERRDRVEFTIRELGDFTSTIKHVEPGTIAYLDGPHSTFSLDRHDAPGYVFLAGGVGMVPLMSMLRTMADRGDARPVLLLYGSYSWDTIIYREELEALEKRLPNLKVVHVLEKPPADWEGETGYMNAELLDRHLGDDRSERFYFICGPIPMLNAVERALAKLHIPHQQIDSERYEMA